MKLTRKLILMILLILIGSFTLLPPIPLATSAPEPLPLTPKEYGKIFLQCNASAGNGFNHAATLAWLSETLAMKAEEAIRYQKSTSGAKKVGIYLQCFSGGSSASIVSTIFMNLLQNKNLIPDAGDGKIHSPQEVQLLSKALRFLALSVDENSYEQLRTQVHCASTLAESGAIKLLQKSGVLPLYDRLSESQQPRWWTGLAPDYDAIAHFLKTVRLAQILAPQHLERPLPPILNKLERKVSAKYGLSSLIDQPQFHQPSELPSLTNAPQDALMLTRLLRLQSQEIMKLGNNILSEDFKRDNAQYSQRFGKYLVDAKSEMSNPFTKTLNQKMLPGFCTTYMASFEDQYANLDLKQTPTYAKLRNVISCDQKTLENILANPLYQQHIRLKRPYVNRFVFAATNSLRGAIMPSIREPNLLAPLAGVASDQSKFAISQIYDPQVDQQLHDENPNYIPVDIKSEEANAFNPAIAVAGGFPDRRMAAWPMIYYGLTLHDALKAKAESVEPSMELFGKPDDRSQTYFAQRAVKDIFTGPKAATKEREDNLKDWNDFATAFCQTFADLTPPYAIKTTTLNWDLVPLPAATIGISRLLVVKTLNATRFQAGERGPIVFDPHFTSDHVAPIGTRFRCAPREGEQTAAISPES